MLTSFVRNYGHVLAVVVVLGTTSLLLPSRAAVDLESGGAGGRAEYAGSSEGPWRSEGPTAPGPGDGIVPEVTESSASGPAPAPGPAPASPGTEPSAHECRADGRMPGAWAHMPPCVPPFTGDNGGATMRGVTRDKIVVARLVSEADPLTQATINAYPGDIPSNEDMDRLQRGFLRYVNTHLETYGRELVFVDLKQSGDVSNDEAGRADARRVIEEAGAFAAIPGPGASLSAAFIEELGARGGICLGCAAFALWRSAYTRYPGSLWQVLGMPLEEHYAHAAEYIVKRLAGQTAAWAGEAALSSKARTFGLVWMDGDASGPHRDAKQARDFFVRELAASGVQLAAEASYVFDLARMQEHATSVIARMKAGGVSTVVCFCDGVTTSIITLEATRQLYRPEWLNPGVRAMDAAAAARLYDQDQWSRSFGFTSFAVPAADPAAEVQHRVWRHARPGEPVPKGMRAEGALYFEAISLLGIGVQMAGPRLTRQTFADGLYAYPESGGGPLDPLMRPTPGNPSSVADMAEIWWNPDTQGVDESNSQGRGMYHRVDGGRRHRLGQWPAGKPPLFDPQRSVVTAAGPFGVPHEADGHTHPSEKRCRSCP